jgi:fructokinase
LKGHSTASTLCLAGIGEILMDKFSDGMATLGGAPFNLTFHLHQVLAALGQGEAVFVSAVGDDTWGKDIRKQAEEAGVVMTYLTTDTLHPTGAALVFANAGEAGFAILPDVAWDYLRWSPEIEALAIRTQAVAFGSLAQRTQLSRETIQRFVSQVDGPRLYDVNLRRNTTNGISGYSAEIVSASLELATIVKMNDAELEEVAQMLGFSSEERTPEARTWDLMEQFLHQYELSAITVTRGRQGALLLGGQHRLQLADSTLPPEKVHPVGAGDSFAAGLLFGMVSQWSMEHALELAELLANWVVTYVTATPSLTPEILSRIRTLADEASRDAKVVMVSEGATR